MYNGAVQAQTWSNQRERRYQPSRDDAKHVIAVLRQQLPVVRYHDGDTSIVATTYLDTKDHHYYHSGGADHSLKLRIREYLWNNGVPGELAFHDTCFLERKQRDGDVRLKQRIEVSKRDVVKIVLGDRSITGDSPEAQAIRTELASLRLRPVMVSAYERLVFGDEVDLRVTYDERVGFYPPPRGLYNMASALTPEVLGPPLARGPSRILEVKQQAGAPSPDWLEQMLAQLTAAPGYSKFRDGMKAMADSDGVPVSLTKRLTPLG